MDKGLMIHVLDHGSVRLVDWMGSDARICDVASISYDVRKRTDVELIDYMMEHEHSGPFEHVEFEFHIKAPIFVARQWLRCRTASTNEKSGRYSILKGQFYVPSEDHLGALLTSKVGHIRRLLESANTGSYDLYEYLMSEGLPKELARLALPLTIYTQWFWKIDLHNLLRFLKLRTHKSAQWEIRQYAETIAGMVREVVPLTWAAFEKHVLKNNAK